MNFQNIKNKKYIQDYIHQQIEIDNFYLKFINHFQFQRLRDIKQLPTSCFSFPSVNHTRFEHSLGTFSIANKYMKFLKNNQPELNISKSLINSVSLSGLCHNLGSPPYSSSFINFLKEKYNFDFNVSEMSYKIFENIIDTENIDYDNKDKEDEQFDINICKKIISGNKNITNYYEEIVNNTKNGIDSCIFDYLKRDMYKFGFPTQGIDFQILTNNALIIDNKICFRENDINSINDLWNNKINMNKKFYLHKVTKSVELMIKDIFLYSDEQFKYLEKINNLNDFLTFTDFILKQIKLKNSNNNNSLKKAQELIKRIEKRNLYYFVGTYDSINLKSSFETFNEETLLKYTSSDYINLTKDDIRINKIKLNLGNDNKDPLLNIPFYKINKKNNTCEVVYKKREEIDHMLPNKFEEQIIMIYITEKNEEKLKAAIAALTNYCKDNGTQANIYKSPKKLMQNYNPSLFSKKLFN